MNENNLLPFGVIKRHRAKKQHRCSANTGYKEIVSKLDNILQDCIDCNDMLVNILKGGDT